MAKQRFNKKKWKKQVDEIIKKHAGSSLLTAVFLAAALCLDKKTLNRRLKRFTGYTTLQYINRQRLWLVRKAILNKTITSVNKAAKAAGFKKVSHFTKLFTRRFGILPSVLIEKVTRR